MQEMVIYGVSFDMVGKQPIVLLKTVEGRRFLPIWIGSHEAASIMMRLQGQEPARPLTHDLIVEMLGEIDATCTQVTVTEVRDAVFFAVMTLNIDGRTIEVDCRPSDAIAVAVRCGATIYAADDLLAEVGIEVDQEGEEIEEADVVEKFKDFLDQVSPEDFASGQG
ncbi:MAG TPA: bifunctional nuclease family protein [Solirubrobacteraceae bacterium]|nr:bifunctional nuclease family protein [Solirubrobacteraceae bacterium]